MCMVCSSAPMTADRLSRAAFSDPGRLRIRLLPRVPATARDSMARGVIFSPSTHMATGMAGISRSSTARVASGVTSRGESPVPPVVTISPIRFSSAHSRSAPLICSCSSGTTAVWTTSNPACSSMARTAGPLVSCRSPRLPRSLTVMTAGMVHENDAAERLLALCGQENMTRSQVKEGKIELKAACDGLFLVDSARLVAVNSQDEVMIATRKGGTAVRTGDKLAGMRVIPLIIAEEKLRKAEQAAGSQPLLALKPFVRKTACIVSTGGEVKKGLIKDTFTPVVIDKLKALGIETLETVYSGDGVENVRDAVLAMRAQKPDMILCTGGMSVDPDDNTPGGIKAAGADIVCYGAPVLPGAMFLLGYFEDGMPVMGLPGCVMYAGATIFDLMLPKVAADVPVTRADIAALGEGGLCLGCKECHYPICPFGK